MERIKPAARRSDTRPTASCRQNGRISCRFKLRWTPDFTGWFYDLSLLTAAIFSDLYTSAETSRRVFELLNMFPFTRAPVFPIAMDFDFSEKTKYIHAHENRLGLFTRASTVRSLVKCGSDETLVKAVCSRKAATPV
jgi:hypothetical protein